MVVLRAVAEVVVNMIHIVISEEPWIKYALFYLSWRTGSILLAYYCREQALNLGRREPSL